MENEKLSYSEAIDEMGTILSEIEDDELDVDDLSSKVKRVSELIAFCQKKLKDTEEEVENILKEI